MKAPATHLLRFPRHTARPLRGRPGRATFPASATTAADGPDVISAAERRNSVCSVPPWRIKCGRLHPVSTRASDS
jgi:hypothetical protein